MENKQTVLEKVINDLEQMKEDGIKFMTIDDFISELYQAKEMERKQIADFIDKISSLTGCLKLLRDGKKLPFELNDLIDESEYFTKTYENE